MKRLLVGAAFVLFPSLALAFYGSIQIDRVTCDTDGERFPDVPVARFRFKNPGVTVVYVSTGSGLTADTNYPSYGTDEGEDDIRVSNMNFLWCKTALGTQVLNLFGEKL